MKISDILHFYSIKLKTFLLYENLQKKGCSKEQPIDFHFSWTESLTVGLTALITATLMKTIQ